LTHSRTQKNKKLKSAKQIAIPFNSIKTFSNLILQHSASEGNSLMMHNPHTQNLKIFNANCEEIKKTH
jgi:hypothetical protein